jgi:hypothetical protein
MINLRNQLMDTTTQNLDHADYLDSYKNWLQFNLNKECHKIYEYPLYSDHPKIGGQIAFFQNKEGILDFPYEILNVCNLSSEFTLYSRLILRIYDHLEPLCIEQNISKAKTLYSHPKKHNYTVNIDWHEQIAVLLSLIYGIRLKAGDLSREIQFNTLDIGIPRGFYSHFNPDGIRLINSNMPILPNVVSYLSRDGIDISKERYQFLKFGKLKSGEDAFKLVQAAKLYRDALWFAESEPSFSWVLLVSAIETVAVKWCSDNKLNTLNKLNNKYPILQRMFPDNSNKINADNPIDKKDFIQLKFCAFLLEHFPSAPPIRPPEYAQVLWTKENILPILKIIYKHRSKMLHEGTHFPQEICCSPLSVNFDNLEKIILEKPDSNENNSLMFLQTFEYIVRYSILKWFDSLVLKN